MLSRKWIFAIALAMPGVGSAEEVSQIRAVLAQSRQLVVVTTGGWSESHGTLALYDREPPKPWRIVAREVPVMLGRNGLGWGIGLYPQLRNSSPAGGPTKREGDGRSPAGVFELERIYGRDPRPSSLRFAYRQMSAVMEGIDDPRSRFYNRLVDAGEVRAHERDWSRSEKVRASNPMFLWLVNVKHNWGQRPAAGSCIWLHIWKAPGVTTSGCTAMSQSDLSRIVHWLDARKQPLLVQLPEAVWQAIGVIADEP